MLASDSMRLTRSFLLPAALAAGLFAAACGDGPDPVSTATISSRTPTQAAQATATIKAPVLPDGAFEKISPAHGAKVTQASTKTLDPRRPSGVCFQANFEGLEKNTLWFRMVLDEKEVTVEKGFTWILPVDAQTTPPKGGTACYAPDGGLSVGIHRVTVAVQNPDNAQEPTRQFMEWQFEVTP